MYICLKVWIYLSLICELVLGDDFSKFPVEVGHPVDCLHAEVPLVNVRVVSSEVVVFLESQCKDRADLAVEHDIYHCHVVSANKFICLIELFVEHTQKAMVAIDDIALLLLLVGTGRLTTEDLGWDYHADKALSLGLHLELEPVQVLLDLSPGSLGIEVL